ncbi:MAG: AAA family ATPase [Flavobacterium sp.]
MTILIGDQATGKSTIAKVLAVCRYFSYIVNYNEKTINYLPKQFYEGLKQFQINGYIKEDSEIFYENSDYSVKFPNEVLFELKIISNSERFSNLLKFIEDNKSKNNHLIQIKEDWNPSEFFFTNEVGKILKNPLFIPIERLLQSISFNKLLLLSDATEDQLRKLKSIAMNYSNPTEIPVLDLNFYSNNGYDFVKRKEEKSFYKLAESASGWQSTTPIVLGVKYYNEIKPKPKTFIIEEPENNLFPKTQKKLVEFFVENINNHGHQFILPTHSPYILSSLNDLLLAYKRGQQFPDKVINLGYKKDIWLNPNDLSVYQLHENDGTGTTSENILSEDTRLIKRNIIDDFSDELDDNFDNLLDVE